MMKPIEETSLHGIAPRQPLPEDEQRRLREQRRKELAWRMRNKDDEEEDEQVNFSVSQIKQERAELPGLLNKCGAMDALEIAETFPTVNQPTLDRLVRNGTLFKDGDLYRAARR